MQTRSSRELDDVTSQFMSHRPKLYAIAHRSLGSPWAADDAVQETWLRLERANIGSINNIEAWLTTVISRVCIDLIRQQASRREDQREYFGAANLPAAGDRADPSETVMRADDLALAMQVILDTLGPLERLTVVLHDVFASPYEDIAHIIDRSPVATRQLASRARVRLRRVDINQVRDRQDAAINAFLDAARQGDFGSLLQLLDPEIELRSDTAAVALASEGVEDGAPLLDYRVRCADAVSRVFAGRAELTRRVFIGSVPAAAYITDGTLRALYLVRFEAARITKLDVLADPTHIALHLETADTWYSV